MHTNTWDEIHLLCKSRLIQTYIMAVGSYGAEWIAMGQKRTFKIQARLNLLLLCTELGITPYSIHGTKQQICLWLKRPHLQTILGDLIACPAKSAKGKTWVQNTKRNLDILTRGADLVKDTPSAMRELKLNLHPPALKPEGAAGRVTEHQQAERRYTYIPLTHFGRTANFIATSLHVPRVNKGVTYLSKLWMGALPTAKEHIQTLNTLQQACSFTGYICPCCGHFFESEEWCHYVLKCTIDTLNKYTEGETDVGLKHLYILILGGLLRELYPESISAIGDKTDPFMETTSPV
ncbi:hypothetical protein VP01_18g5 [Puccinia sorghi]|uniref:Uncharacterized protein n=1 Tax=Puccinia sorghi TaxID=27349 RepID=A0A0L6VCZ6_9BASI|nr:hypothetical protein VP01_18g5 [Puccinia sorghi]